MNDGAAPLLQLVSVDKRYPPAAPGEPPQVVLSGISLTLHKGESIAIVGPSGSGKSTLLAILGALDRPSAGRVLLDGNDLGALDDDHAAEVRRRDLGFVFQLHHLLPQCTALENVLVPALASPTRPDRRAMAALDERARSLLAKFGLAHRLHHRPAQLSGGECQRVAVARALLLGPRLLIADEPTGSLDRRGAADLGDLLVDLNRKEGLSLVVATHAEALAARLGRVLVLDGGTLSEAERAG